MEKYRSYNDYRMDPKQTPKKFKKDINEINFNHVKKNIPTHKRKDSNRDTPSLQKLKTSQNNSVKSNNRRTYTKRTELIQERIKILQLAKKNIDNSDNIYEEQNINKRTELSSSNRKIKITDNKIESYKEIKNNVIPQNNHYLLNILKNEEHDNNNLLKKNLITNDNKYIKKIPIKTLTNSTEKKPNFRKYETSTFFNNKSKKHFLMNKTNEKPNNFTYYNENNLLRNNSNVKRKKKDNDNNNKENVNVNDIDIIGYRTGFVYHTKIKKTRLNFEDSSQNSPSKRNSYIFKKAKSKNKSVNNVDLLIQSPNNTNNIKSPNTISNIKSPNIINNINSPNNSNSINNIKEVKDEYDSENDLFGNKGKELNNIYIPKKIHHLIRGTSQEDIHNTNQKNYVSSNTSLKDRYKSYKQIDNYSNNNKNNNINININNNIKIITYNKKKPSWKKDKKKKI